MRKNPIDQIDFIKKEFVQYIRSTFLLKNEKYNEDFRSQLIESDLFKGPYLKAQFPFMRGKTVNEMINLNLVNPLFKKLKNAMLDIPLYTHQEEAINLISKGHNAIITTGTGSGKTEAFTYPIINELLNKISTHNKVDGIQAIILYPMNALVNDQLERFRKLLKDYPKITFGYFTGDTPEYYRPDGSYSRNRKDEITREQYIKEIFDEEEIKPPPNELLTREEIRKNPPNILITNFSMLEYLLVRPKDSEIINENTMKQWSFMVLDEAHSYRGTLASEIAHLLRRLQNVAKRSPQFILTSATLGKQGENEKDVAKFAEKLTNSTYYETDIIFAKRYGLERLSALITVEPNDYLKLLDNGKDQTILKKHNKTNLYDLLIADINVSYLLTILKGQTKTFNEVLEFMKTINSEFNIESLTSLINLITNADDNDGIVLCDINYHFLIRTLEGAFISLGKNTQLKIKNRQKIDDMWAFEIATCKNCHHHYILGKEITIELDGDKHKQLYRSELDIDENYEIIEGADIDTDIFIVNENIEGQIEDYDDGKLEPYIVCAKCGIIYESDRIGYSGCGCGDEHKVELLKVINKGNKKNNLTKCVLCNKVSNVGGVLQSFKVSKDQSTALLSQIILKSMEEENKVEAAAAPATSDIAWWEAPIYQKEETREVHQFLAFSDSRQQASFYAMFFQQMQDRFLRNAVVYDELKEKMKIETLVTRLEKRIDQDQLFSHGNEKSMSASNHAQISVYSQLLKVDGKNSLDGLALIDFVLDLSNLDNPQFKSEFSKNVTDLTYEEFKVLCNIFVDKFRTAPAIQYVNDTLTYEQKQTYLDYRANETFMTLHIPRGTRRVNEQSYLPANLRLDNKWTAYLKKTFNFDDEKVKKHTEMIWNVLKNVARVLVSDKSNPIRTQIDFTKFNVVPYKKTTWYQCDTCHIVTTKNIKDKCPSGGCEGLLEKCDPDLAFKDNYYRKEYMEKTIKQIIIEEHTGQLTRKQAREIQKDFKNKKINILSSSTTFEMGVDIGSLDTVFMRNMPPTPANYVQRAGRAGRSKDSVALVITYANHRSHDQMYFNNPTEMIDGNISPPVFKLDNAKITSRHIFAFIINKYFRTTNTIPNLNEFINVSYESFMDFIESNKDELEEELILTFADESFMSFSNFRWYEDVFGENSLLQNFLMTVNKEISDFTAAINANKKANNFVKAEQLKRSLDEIYNMEIVMALSKYNVIPGYGFPIDVVPLKIFDYRRNRFNKHLDLGRNLSIAVSEYAPDSEVIVRKQKYRSRYVVLLDNKELPTYYYNECTNDDCRHVEYKLTNEENNRCPLCNSRQTTIKFVVPAMGFINERPEKVDKIIKPRVTFSAPIKYLGSVIKFKPDLDVNNKGVILIEKTENDELLVINENPFFMCEKCGYSKLVSSEKYRQFIDEKHDTHLQIKCSNEQLKRTGFGHIIKTDVIKMRFNVVMSYKEALSAVAALTNGVCNVLQIDRRDIDGLVTPYKEGGFIFIFYDTTYGGSGNVKELLNEKGLYNILHASLNSVSNNCCNEDVSCYSCLRNYDNSYYHKYLERGLAKAILEKMINSF